MWLICLDVLINLVISIILLSLLSLLLLMEGFSFPWESNFVHRLTLPHILCNLVSCILYYILLRVCHWHLEALIYLRVILRFLSLLTVILILCLGIIRQHWKRLISRLFLVKFNWISLYILIWFIDLLYPWCLIKVHWLSYCIYWLKQCCPSYLFFLALSDIVLFFLL